MTLEDLVNQKRAAVGERARSRDVSTYIEQVGPSRRSLAARLSHQDRLGYILECEKKAPWRQSGRVDFDPAVLARTFAPFADAISVSTGKMFGGRLEYIEAVRQAVDVPVICNDLIVDPYQIYEARWFGADAIPLMLGALDEERFDACISVADKLSMDVLAVVVDQDQLERALAAGVDIVAIGNRDIDAGNVDVTLTGRLGPMVPDDCLAVAVGGVRDHQQVRRLREHVDAFLTGGSLLEHGSVEHKLREMVYGNVKVCGLTRPADARAAWEAGAVYGGLIFAPHSARCVTYDRARAVIAAAPLRYVGVFVDDPVEDVACCAEALGMSAVQLHGSESNDYILELRRQLPKGCEVWKACHVGDELPSLSAVHADRILLDNFARGIDSAQGIFDWSLIESLQPRQRQRVLLGGGITPQNAHHADALGTWGLDVNIGVENSAGMKSHVMLDRFFTALRGKRRQA